MDAAELIGNILGAAIFIVWLVSMYGWLKQGGHIPKYVHLMALVLTSLSVGLLLGMTSSGTSSLKVALLFLIVPPAAAYFGWFWLFGPDLRDDKKQ